jgi:hypothetical protein
MPPECLLQNIQIEPTVNVCYILHLSVVSGLLHFKTSQQLTVYEYNIHYFQNDR